MSEIQNMKCDNCGKLSKDICGDLNWISFNWASENGLVVSVSGGRPEGKDHKSKSYKSTNSNVDFCSVECMLHWMGLMPVCNEPKGFIIINYEPKGD
jgi:hypothetical protein